jgi:hypothetical protein
MSTAQFVVLLIALLAIGGSVNATLSSIFTELRRIVPPVPPPTGTDSKTSQP